jgi:hypothetical protein
LHSQLDHQIYFHNFQYLFQIQLSIHVRITYKHQEMRHVIYIFYVIDKVMHELNLNSKFHLLVHSVFHQE